MVLKWAQTNKRKPNLENAPKMMNHVQLNTGPADQRQITALIAKNVEKKHNWMESQLPFTYDYHFTFYFYLGFLLKNEEDKFTIRWKIDIAIIIF